MTLRILVFYLPSVVGRYLLQKLIVYLAIGGSRGASNTRMRSCFSKEEFLLGSLGLQNDCL